MGNAGIVGLQQVLQRQAGFLAGMVEQYLRGQFGKDNHPLYQSAPAFAEGRQVPGIQVNSMKQ